MNTDELIAMLARGDAALARPRGGLAGSTPLAAVATALAASIALTLLTLHILPTMAQALVLPAFWLKVGFVLATAGAAWYAANRLARPGARMGASPWLLLVPVLVLWLTGAVLLAGAAPQERTQLFWGSTWRVCPPLIAMLSAPLLAVALWLMRRMAPTRLKLAGAAAGLAAGAGGALVYCLHCPEMSPVFVGSWYLLGMLVPTAIGAMLGPKVLAW